MINHCILKLMVLFIMPYTQSTRGAPSGGASSEGARLIINCNLTHLEVNGMQGDLFLYFQATNNVSQCVMASSFSNTSFHNCSLDPYQVPMETGGNPNWFIKVDIHNVKQENAGLYQCIWKENTEYGEDSARAYETEKMEFNLINPTSHFRFTLNNNSRIVTLDMNFTPNQPACEPCHTRICIITSSVVIAILVVAIMIRELKRATLFKQNKTTLL